ncbi:Enoyl-[acyl-carrier-protein] reductase [NADH] [hydrothermal vent metagenome]|uniref:Enoyl-[acyl-carrier-protein] reductase [NADH] n=1 Tax=hydrothermal vent metagenome TaxID=652676 RepID=A0A3B1D746_9ZZZZ
MGLFTGKKGLIFGIANDRSIAWAITKELHKEGAEIGFTHLPDRDPERRKAEKKLRKLVDPLDAKLVMPCDASQDEDLDAVFKAAEETFGKIDFVLHSMAFAPIEELKCPVYEVSRAGWNLSMEISAYSLIAIAGRAQKIMNPGGSILAMTYLGGEKVIPGYNLMGVCKAALESSLEYLAHELGPKGIRVNAVSAGPVKTLAASAVGEFSRMMKLYETFSPLRRNIKAEEVGKSGMFLLSDMASGITGENLHVDCGYHIMGGPPLDAANEE